MSDEFEQMDEELDGPVVVDEVFPNEAVRDQLMVYLQREFDEIRDSSERQQFLEDLQEFRRISMAQPKVRVKDTPWPGAANVATPFTFSNVNGVFAHLKAAIAEKRPRWQVEACEEEYVEHAGAWQRWMNELLMSELHMNIAEKDEVMMFDGARLGTQFAEVPWTTKRTQFKRRAVDGSVELVDKVVYDGPMIKPIRIEDVIIRSHWNVQDAPYVGFRYEFTKQELLQEEYNGFFVDVERIFAQTAQRERSREVENQQFGAGQSSYEDLTDGGTTYEVVKWYVKWDADEDGVAEDLIVWMEPQSRVVLRAEWNELGVRPIGVGAYIKFSGIIYGMGVCAMLYRLQEEIDTMHNIGIDSLHISSLQMFATPHGSGLSSKEAFFPLKNIELADPQRDLRVITFPNVSMQTIQREQVAQQYGRTVTGISEVQLGMPDTTAKSGTSPSLQQLLAQQGNKILRSVIESFASFYGELAQFVSLQLVANSDRVLAGDMPLLKLAKKEDRELIMEVLMMDVADLPSHFRFNVKTTEADKTEDAKRQMLMMKHQLMAQYMQQGLEIVQMMDNPQVQQMPTVMEFVNQMYVALTKLMEESLSLFDVDKTGDYLPNYEMQELMLRVMDVMKQPQIQQAKQQLEMLENEGQGTTGEVAGAGVYTPGYTADENAAGNAGNQGDPAMAGPPQGGGY